MTFTSLSNIAKVSLGYKSLQNTFFYLNEATIDTFNIERRYLTPMLKLRDMTAGAYEQTVSSSLWLFNCKDKKGDLRGTGALRYIEAMADRSAAEKKQSGKSLTIRQALEAQGGGLWYAPKATPHKHHVWLRKAFDGVFAPFLFEKPALVDQRCNSLSPIPGIEWAELGAVLSSSLFAYSLEINGSASMGAGALEASTTKLRDYPVFDLQTLSQAEKDDLVRVARDLWSKEPPLDWCSLTSAPGTQLRKLDQWLLDRAGLNLKLGDLYKDVKETCRSRKTVAADKIKQTKKKHTENLGNVADSIAKTVNAKMELRNFPDDFVDGAQLDISFDVDRTLLKRVQIQKLLGSFDIELIAADGTQLYENTFPASVAESIVRSLLWGRSSFSVSSKSEVMSRALSSFLHWVNEIESDITKAISESALGTGYEDALVREIYARLGVHPLSGAAVLPDQISL